MTETEIMQDFCSSLEKISDDALQKLALKTLNQMGISDFTPSMDKSRDGLIDLIVGFISMSQQGITPEMRRGMALDEEMFNAFRTTVNTFLENNKSSRSSQM